VRLKQNAAENLRGEEGDQTEKAIRRRKDGSEEKEIGAVKSD